MKVAILGGGVAGCAAAYFLKEGGHDTTIYEKADLGGCSHTRFFENIPYEFEAQVAFTDKDYIREIFEQFLTMYPPPHPSGRYEYKCSIDGTLDNLSDFPVSIDSILRLPNAADIMWELYNLNLDRTEFDNFEAYCTSRFGKTLYETFIKNYNEKAWQMDLTDMDTEWVRFRPLSVARHSVRFGEQWLGHPGNYNPMWEKMSEGCDVVYKEVSIDDDLSYSVDGKPIESDLIVTTLPMSNRLGFVNTCLVFVVLDSEQTIMPRAFTTFPNNYNFVRIFEYRQQFAVDSPVTLISFHFPWKGDLPAFDFELEAITFCKDVLKKPVLQSWVESRETIYPINTKDNGFLFRGLLEETMYNNIVPIGRLGMHAYVSKDTAIRMGYETNKYLGELLDPSYKIDRLLQMRGDLH